MAFKHSMKRGDTLPVLRHPLRPGVDIPPGSIVRFLMTPRPGHPPTVNGDARIVDGFLEYAWASGDTHKGGLHYGEFEVVVPGGGKFTVPDDGFISIQITQDIGDGGAIAPPALILVSGALVEAGADVAWGLGSVGIRLSNAVAEDGSDTASGSGEVGIRLSAAMSEGRPDTASGNLIIVGAWPQIASGPGVADTWAIEPVGEATFTPITIGFDAATATTTITA